MPTEEAGLAVPDPEERSEVPSRIAPALGHAGNRRVLEAWLADREDYEAVPADADESDGSDFDLLVVDRRSYADFAPAVREWRAATPAFLPVLLVGSPADAVGPGGDGSASGESPTSDVVDEVLRTPIRGDELARRLSSLLRIRRQSQRLERQTDQLLLLNRITRHDVRNEMTVVAGFAERLAEYTDADGEEIRRRVVERSRDVVDLADAVGQLVEAAVGSGEPELRGVSLPSVLTAELTKRRTAHDGATFVLEGSIPAVDVRANDLLGSVFRNLLENAVEHNTAAEPRVEISVEENTSAVTVLVADNGPGIPEADRAAVMGRTAAGLGHPAAGLGLYLVDTLVSQYGGTVTITAAEDGGAAVGVDLPKHPTEERP